MVKLFKIIEKIVWIIAALTIAAVLAMVFIVAFANLNKAQFDWWDFHWVRNLLSSSYRNIRNYFILP